MQPVNAILNPAVFVLSLAVGCSWAAIKSSSSAQAAAAAAAVASTHGHQVSIVNLTDFLSDLSKRLEFVIGAYQSNRLNKSSLVSLQSSSFVIAAPKHHNANDSLDHQSSQSYQAVIYVVAVLLCYAAAICAMVVFNFKERRSQAKYEAYEDVVKRPRNYLYHYFREKYKDPSAVALPRKKSTSAGADSSAGSALNHSKTSTSLGHKGSSSGQLLPSSERHPSVALANKMSAGSTSTDTTFTCVSSPTTPPFLTDLSYVAGGGARRKAPSQTAPSSQIVLKESVIPLSPTAEETGDIIIDEEACTGASMKRSHFARRANTDSTYDSTTGGDLTYGMQDVRPSPYLVIDNLEESYNSSSAGGIDTLDLTSSRRLSNTIATRHVKLCTTNSEASSMHSFAGTISMADDDL